MAINDVDKRPRYFAGQYLLEDDFELEQNYHIDRQRRHNRLLHVSGIADGLIVTVSENNLDNVKISAGTAIDKDGRQIVWSAAMAQNPATLQNVNNISTNSSYILSIGYSEDEKEPQEGATNNNRRLYETPKFELTVVSEENKLPKLSDGFIALAKLKVDGQKKVTVDDSGQSVREYSGLRLPSSAIPSSASGGLTLRSKGEGVSNRAELSGSLSVQGSLNVTTNVGIGTTTPDRKLTIKADYSGTSDAQQLLIQGNTNTNYQLLLGYHTGNNYGSIQAMHQGVGGRPLVLNPANGNVGIGTGTTSPTEKLEISGGNLKVGGNLSAINATLSQKLTIKADYSSGTSDAQQLLIQGSTEPNYQLLLGYHTTNNYGSIQAMHQGVGARPLVLNPVNGNVGIGTTTPQNKLDVAGIIRSSQEGFQFPDGSRQTTAVKILTGTLPYESTGGFNAVEMSAAFSGGFSVAPTIFLSLIRIDNNKDRNLRIQASVKTVTTTQLVVRVESWADTIVYAVTVNWLAFGY